MPICSLTDIKKSYQMGDIEVPALRGVTLDIHAREFTVFAGPSGSGKSTLLNILGLLDVPSEGSVMFDGNDVAKLEMSKLVEYRAKRIGFIFQSFNLIPVLTAAENVSLALQLAKPELSKSECASLVEQALTDVGLRDFLHRRPSQLSGGQQQRVAVARALVKQPSIVIADEPTANLDSKSAHGVLDVMLEMNERHAVTFLFSSHDQKVIDQAKRIVWLTDGAIDRIEDRKPLARDDA